MISKNSMLSRFIVILFTLHIFPFPLNLFSGFSFIPNVYHKIIPWIGEHILKLDEPIQIVQTGSGDTLYRYVLFLFFIVIALIGSVIWTLIKNGELSEKVNYYFFVLLRYYLGYVMLTYGLVKVIQLQFPEPSFYKLLQPFGASSPMGLAWTFFGFSKGYNLFMGLGELIGGVLLFHRRTTLLGSLILIAVSANIVAANFFYDIPVKLNSSLILIMAVILMLPHFKRLMNVIVLNRPTSAVSFNKIPAIKKWFYAKMVLKWGFISFVLYTSIQGKLEARNSYGSNAPKPPLYGLYEVTHFTLNKDTLTPNLNDGKRWRYISMENPNLVQIYKMNMSAYYYKNEVDTTTTRMRFSDFRDSTDVNEFRYLETDSSLIVDGIFKNDTIHCETRKRYKEDFPLMNRGFHWISEYPYNR